MRVLLQGDCASALPLQNVTLDPPLSSFGQCVITVDSSLMEIATEESQMLLSDVYIRLDRTTEQQANLVPLLSVPAGVASL